MLKRALRHKERAVEKVTGRDEDQVSLLLMLIKGKGRTWRGSRSSISVQKSFWGLNLVEKNKGRTL
jgi:hypothetical protein